jgi:translation initiation factor IF-1
MKVTPGDVVHVKGTVIRYLKDGVVDVYFGDNSKFATAGVWISESDIVHVEPPPLKVGETVRHQSMDWIVLGVDKEIVWIRTIPNFAPRYASVHRDEVQRYS